MAKHYQAIIEQFASEKQQLIGSLKRMINLHESMCKKINFGESFFDSETISEMNLAPNEAKKILNEVQAND